MTYRRGDCVCLVDYEGPQVRCAEGHALNLNRYPAAVWSAVAQGRCPVVREGEDDYDDGPCNAELREIECWHTPQVLDEMRAEARGASI